MASACNQSNVLITSNVSLVSSLQLALHSENIETSLAKYKQSHFSLRFRNAIDTVDCPARVQDNHAHNPVIPAWIAFDVGQNSVNICTKRHHTASCSLGE